MSPTKDIQNRVNLVVIVLFALLLLIPMAMYFLYLPVEKLRNIEALWGPDSPERVKAANWAARENNPETFAAAVFAMCETADENVVTPLKRLIDFHTMDHTNAEGIDFYHDSLSNMPDDDEYIRRLQKALRDRESPDRRSRALKALAVLDGKTAFDALSEAIDDPEAKVRFRAVFMLSEWRDPQAPGLLIKFLDSEEPKILELARESILERNKLDACRLLITDLRHTNPENRMIAARRLRILTGKNMGYDPKGDEEARNVAIKEWKKEIGLLGLE